MKQYFFLYKILLLFLIASPSFVNAQFGLDSLSIDSLNSLGYDPLIRVFDGFGKEKSPYELIVPDLAPPPPLPPSSQPNLETCTAGMFQLFFQDAINNNQRGFDDLTPVNNHPVFSTASTLGQLRQQALCQVFEDLSSFYPLQQELQGE